MLGCFNSGEAKQRESMAVRERGAESMGVRVRGAESMGVRECGNHTSASLRGWGCTRDAG
jgi:hypothetical protein